MSLQSVFFIVYTFRYPGWCGGDLLFTLGKPDKWDSKLARPGFILEEFYGLSGK